jgi:hypothetical protein
MSKIQTIIYLFVFLIVLFSMDMVFGNPLRETFRGGGGGGLGLGGRGIGLGGGGLGLGGGGLGLGGRSGLGGGLIANRMAFNRNINNNSLTTNDVPPYYFEQSDDEPLFFNWFNQF